MNGFLKSLRSTAFIVTAILAGICLFLIQVSLDANKSVLNPEFHEQLFIKYDIYSHAYTIIDNSMTGFVNNLKTSSPQNYEQHKDIFLALEKSITPGTVKSNLDSITEGIFQYLKGEKQFLPDISINTQIKSGNQDSAIEPETNIPEMALANIDKINLSTILLYTNGYAAIDYLTALRFVFYLMGVLPGFSLLAFLFLALAGLILCSRLADAARWSAITLLSCGVMSLLSGAASFIYFYVIMPGSIFRTAIPLPIQAGSIISYLHECIIGLITFITLSGVFFTLLSAAVFSLPKFFPGIFSSHHNQETESHHISRNILKRSFYVLLFLAITSTMVYKLNSFKKDFDSNDFTPVISRLMGASTITQVISAKDDVIYALQVRLVDKKNNTPVSNMHINVASDPGNQNSNFNETATTDETGTARFVLDRGPFLLSFTADNRKDAYQIPQPLPFTLKTAGTTIITMNLDPQTAEKSKTGIAEIEILDGSDNPVPGLKLSAEGFMPLVEFHDGIYSYTNSEGIAVFKINEGDYNVSFAESKIPHQYDIPNPLDITVKPDTVTRYTIKLVNSKSQNNTNTPKTSD